MVLEQNTDLDADATTILPYFFGFRALLKNHDHHPTHIVEIAYVIVKAECLFVFTLGIFILPSIWMCAFSAVAAAVLAAHVASVPLVLVLSFYKGKMAHQPVFIKAMIYWSWWPCWTFAFGLLAMVLGAICGSTLWQSYFQPYYELSGKQYYGDINPMLTSGQQIQDAGAVTFSEGVQIDRTTGGCIVDHGKTYCVAPIVYSGDVHGSLKTMPSHGTFDYFAVGIDCCTCPGGTNFQCGDWKNPFAHAGIRSADPANRAFYRLAVRDWSTSSRKDVGHPLLFDWVHSPKHKIAWLWTWPVNFLMLFACGFYVIVAMVGFKLAWLLDELVSWNVAAADDVPTAPAGFAALWRRLLPGMVEQHTEDSKHLVRLPLSPMPNYGSTPHLRRI